MTFVTCSGSITTSGTSGVPANSSGDISVSSTAAISTTGDYASGIQAQSASGGHISVDSSGNISTTGADANGIMAYSQGGVSNSASVTTSGAISTTGNNAAGVYLSLVPDGTTTHSSALVMSSSAISTSGESAAGISVFNFLGSASGTGTISVYSHGLISTTGSFSDGIGTYNQSSGATNIAVDGAIRVAGAYSSGIYAASLGGPTVITSNGSISSLGLYGAGIYALSSGAGGTIAIQANGNITTSGQSSSAILANSFNNAEITVDVGAGATLSSPIDSRTLDLTGGNVTVNNSGIIHGNVYAGGTWTSFNNARSGVLNSGSEITLSTTAGSGTLTNSGTISPGGAGALRTTTLTGDFVQTSTGRLAVDTSWQNGTSDRLAVTGTATIAGTVIVNPINLGSQAGLTRTFTILTAAGGIIDNGIAVTNTAAATYAIARPDANTLNVTASIDFRGNATVLNADQRSIATALNTTFAAGNSLGFMPALLTIGNSGYASALMRLAPTSDAASFSGAMQTGNTFANHLLSCRVAGETGEANRFIREGQCVWARIGARRLESEGRSDNIGFGETSSFFSAGAQLKLHGDWRVGAGIGYEQSSLTTSTKSSSQADRLHLGGVVKYNPGPWLLAASVTGGHGWHDNRRNVAFGGFSSVATSDSESSFVAGRLTAAYLMSRGDWYLKPQIEVASTQLMRDSYVEQGTGGVALRVARSNANVTSFSPSVELGTEHTYHGTMYRAFIRGGASFRDKDTFVTTATFADAASAPFTTATRIDRMTADIGAGIDVLMPGSTNVRVQYDGQLGQRTTSHSGSAKVSVPF